MRTDRLFLVVASCVLSSASVVFAQEGYRLPPPAMTRIIDAQPAPEISVSPDGQWLVLIAQQDTPRIRDLAEPSVVLMQYEIDPRTGARHADRTAMGTGYTLVRTSDGRKWPLDTPTERLSRPLWSPDSRQFLFRHTTEQGVELWSADIHQKRARAVTGPVLNMLRATDVPCVWMRDNQRAICQMIPADRGAPPVRPEQTFAPFVQESEQTLSRAELWPGRHRDEFDLALYEYYMSAEPVAIGIATGERTSVAQKGIYDYLSPSPDGRYLLTVRTVRPYSLLGADDRFPKVIEILDASGKTVRSLAEQPQGHWGNKALGWAAPGARWFSWAPTQPAALVYVEALDGGDPRQAVLHRDRLMLTVAPFTDPPREVMRTEGRLPTAPTGMRFVREYGNIAWLNDGRAWIEERDFVKQRKRVWLVPLMNTDSQPRLIREYGIEDRSEDPGSALLLHSRGYEDVAGTEEPLLRQQGDWIYLVGPGASEQGDRPFLDRFNVRTLRTERLFRADGARHEEPITVLDPAGHRILTTAETARDPADYFFRDLRTGGLEAVTHTAHPAPELRSVSPQLITYVRADGLSLSGELYLPVGYKKGQRVPTVIWAYPISYVDRAAASRARGSPNRFIWTQGHGFARALRSMVTQGYAVLWYASMPVVGGAEANDSAVAQLTANARAAVDKLVDMGVADRNRIAIAGHSYGGLMTATLLASSDLFAAGIAIEGVYNLTNAPMGVQHEERTFWEAPDAYLQLSALLHADRIKAPLLLIHSELDNSHATTPAEAQRMYQALSGLGKKTRLVMLPHEDHAPKARESTLHIAWEMLTWLNRYLRSEDPSGPLTAIRAQ